LLGIELNYKITLSLKPVNKITLDLSFNNAITLKSHRSRLNHIDHPRCELTSQSLWALTAALYNSEKSEKCIRPL